MSAGNHNHAAGNHIGAVAARNLSAVGAHVLGAMHLAIHSRSTPLCPPVRYRAVAGIRIAGFRCQLAGHCAGRHFHKAVLAGIAVQNVLIRQVGMNLGHVCLPKGCCRTGTGGLAGQGLVIVVTNPNGRSIVARHAGKEHALLVGVGARLACHRLSANLGIGTGAALDGCLQHIHNHVGRGFGEDPAAGLIGVTIPDHIAFAIRNAKDGNRLLIHAAIGQHAKGHRHLQGCNAAGTQRQAKGGCVNVIVINAQPMEEVHRAVNAHHGHQGLGSRRIVALHHGSAQGFRPGVSAAAVVLGPRIFALAVFPAGNRYRHIVYNAGRTAAQLKCRSINGDRLNGRANRHLHIRCPVQGLPLGWGCSAAYDGLDFASAVIQHHRRHLRLHNLRIGAVRVAGAVHLIRRVSK